jgi:hypothetical protein
MVSDREVRTGGKWDAEKVRDRTREMEHGITEQGQKRGGSITEEETQKRRNSEQMKEGRQG